MSRGEETQSLARSTDALVDSTWKSAFAQLPFWRVALVGFGWVLLCTAFYSARSESQWASLAPGLGLYAILIVGLVLAARKHHHGVVDLMGERPRLRLFGWAFLVTIAMLGVRIGWLSLLSSHDAIPEYWNRAKTLPPTNGRWMLLRLSIVALLAPCAEEAMFRGVMFVRLLRYMRPAAAAFGSSVLFGLFHFDFVGATLFGLAMMGLCVQTRSLWAPLAAHALTNLVCELDIDGRGDALLHLQGPITWISRILQLCCAVWLLWFLHRSLRPLLEAQATDPRRVA